MCSYDVQTTFHAFEPELHPVDRFGLRGKVPVQQDDLGFQRSDATLEITDILRQLSSFASIRCRQTSIGFSRCSLSKDLRRRVALPASSDNPWVPATATARL